MRHKTQVIQKENMGGRLCWSETYFSFHEGYFGRRRQQAGGWVQNQGDCLMTEGAEKQKAQGGRQSVVF